MLLKHLTKRVCDKLPHATEVTWWRESELDNGKLIHDIDGSFIEWNDGQRTYTSDDAAMKFVFMPSAALLEAYAKANPIPSD